MMTAILITGGLTAVQYAYSSGPDTLTVKYLTPINPDTDVTTFIQIYKKTDDFASLPLGPEIPINAQNEEFMVISQNYGKDKLNSNTVFRVIERTGIDDVEIDVIEIHTSCSQSLYKGQVVPGINGIVTLEVVDGTLLGDSIIPDNVGEDCTDKKGSKHTAILILKKAITNDNGGEITDTIQIQESFLPQVDGVDVVFGEPITISTKEPHTFSEAEVDGYSFVLIAGDTDCPSMLGEEFTVKKNKEITCTIYNDDNFIPDGAAGPKPTVTLEVKIVDPSVGVVQNGPVFQVGDDPTNTFQHGDLAAVIDANVATTVSQVSDGIVDNEEEEVLPTKITGDGNCPEVLAGEITLSSGQDITCTLEYGKVVEPGVVFHFNTLEFSFDSDLFGDSCDIEGKMPCVEMANAQVGGTILIVDEVFATDTTIYLFSIIEQDKIDVPRPVGSMGILATSPLCTFSGLSPHDLGYALQPIDPSDPGDFDNSVDNPSDNLGFAVTCVGSNPTGDYQVNYALIETVR